VFTLIALFIVVTDTENSINKWGVAICETILAIVGAFAVVASSLIVVGITTILSLFLMVLFKFRIIRI
jgi:hypothetical protein